MGWCHQRGAASPCKASLPLAAAFTTFLYLSMATGQQMNAAQPLAADFWDAAPEVEISSSAGLAERLQTLSANTITILKLGKGDFSMPPHASQTNISLSVDIRGSGINLTFVHWEGNQGVVRLRANSVLAFSNLTMTGATIGKFYSSSNPSVFPEDYPVYSLRHVESLTAVDDINVPPNFEYSLFANAVLSRTYQMIEGDLEEIVARPNDMMFPAASGVFIVQVELVAIGIGKYMWHIEDSIFRPSKEPVLSIAYQTLTEQSQYDLSKHDCWDDSPGVMGFTYRGKVNTTVSGAACLPWEQEGSTEQAVAPYAPNLEGFSSTEANFCRNPRFYNWDYGPWCFSTDVNRIIEPCGIPQCSQLQGGGDLDESGSGRLVIIICAALGTVLAAIVLCCAGICFWRQRRNLHSAVPLEASDRGYEAVSTRERFPWHPQFPFHTVPHATRGVDPNKRSLSIAAKSMFPINQMLSHPLASKLDSLCSDTLQYKYGSDWNSRTEIDTHSLIGEGAHGKVYCGTYNGRPAAFKVLNELKTIPSLVRFVHKTVLPEVSIQQFLLSQHERTMRHPHLLTLLDCQMFPSYTGLMMLSGDDNSQLSPIRAVSSTRSEDEETQFHSSSIDRPSFVCDPSQQSPESAQPNESNNRNYINPILMRSHSLTYLWSCSSGATISFGAAAPNDAAPGMMLDGSYPASARPLVAEIASASHLSQPDNTDCGATEKKKPPQARDKVLVDDAYLKGVSDSGRQGDHKSIRKGRKLQDGSDVLLQVIMVSPLCELGSLTGLLQNRQQMHVSSLPGILQGALARELSQAQASRQDSNHKSTRTIERPDSPSHDTVTLSQLPEMWQMIFKLQMAVQIVDGVTALHSVSLVHCDIKLDNVFLTADPDMVPFGICAKVADLDTCRDLNVSRYKKFSRQWNMDGTYNSVTGVSLVSTNVPLDSHYTSCLKGTPGYLAPEMITMGRVAAHTDVFSLAVTIAIMLSQAAKFKKVDDVRVILIPDYPSNLSSDLVSALDNALLTDPSARPTLRQIREPLLEQLHTFLQVIARENPNPMTSHVLPSE